MGSGNTKKITLSKKGLQKLEDIKRLSDVSLLSSVEQIHLQRNKLTDLSPKVLREALAADYLPHTLTELYLHNNSLERIQSELFHLINLKVLSLHNNRLDSIPLLLAKCLYRLETLHLHQNLLTEVPWNLGYLHHLKRLTLHKNQLETLPNSLAHLPLVEFTFHSNPLPSKLLELSSLRSQLNHLQYQQIPLPQRRMEWEDLVSQCDADSGALCGDDGSGFGGIGGGGDGGGVRTGEPTDDVLMFFIVLLTPSLRERFRVQLGKEYADENLDFYLQVRQIERDFACAMEVTSDELTRRCRGVYEQFFKDGCPQLLNVSSKISRPICRLFADPNALPPPPPLSTASTSPFSPRSTLLSPRGGPMKVNQWMFATARQAVFMLMYNDCYKRFCMLAEEGRVVQEQARRTLLNYRERAKSGSRATRPRARSLPSSSRIVLSPLDDREPSPLSLASPRIDTKLRTPIGLSDDHLAAAAAAAESVALTNRSEKKKGGLTGGRRKSVAVARPKSGIVSALSGDRRASHDSGPSSAPSTSRMPASVAFSMSPRRSKSSASLSSSSEVPAFPVHNYIDPFATLPPKFSSTPTQSAPKLHLVQRGSSTPANLPSPSTHPLGSPSARRSKKRKSKHKSSKSSKSPSASPSSARRKLRHRRNNSTNSIPSSPANSPPPSSATTTKMSSSTPPPPLRGLRRGTSTPLPRESRAIETGKPKAAGRRHRRRRESGGGRGSNRSSKSSEHRKAARKKRKAQSSSTPEGSVASPLRSSTDSESEVVLTFPHSSLSREPSGHSSARPRSVSVSSSSAHSSPPRKGRSRTKSDAVQREKRGVSVGGDAGLYSTSDAVV